MATMVLSAAASAATAGSATFAAGTLASTLLSAGTQVIGGAIDNQLFGAGGVSSNHEGARLKDLAIQSSAYGNIIPKLYGTARIAGNIIWARPIKEVRTRTTQQAGKGGGGASSSKTTYSYYSTMAIAICEGEVDSIERVWADSKLLDLGLGTYRFYTGDETQEPDSLIESYEGVGSTPAYRGLAYVVIEDFPLADYGNRIPNFTFEVKKKLLDEEVEGDAIEQAITSIITIPGSGEFVYDTVEQRKYFGEHVLDEFTQRLRTDRVNQHTPKGKTNALVALDHMAETLPNIEWVGVVVNWFGGSLDAGSCNIYPAVDFKSTSIYDQVKIKPDNWIVGSIKRPNAALIGSDDGAIRYGGTPSDVSVVRYVDELKARGYKVFLIPMFLMNVEGKPWRGHLTGSTTDVANFFTKTNGYNNFILHYANLLDGKVDAFAIGSELRGLTEVQDGSGNFPAVDELVDLAADVKAILGSSVTVTYCADWSEYHHAADGWYHLDPLWASSDIDVVGIDAYFPLTDAPQNELGYDIQRVRDGWTEGEGYDYYYSDEARTTQESLAPAYAWKNIGWWWNNAHVNPDENTTAWVAQSKPIWFTEFGFPSVDGATNQPNIFYDPISDDGGLPYHSRGRIDFLAQRTGIAATLAEWKDSTMVQNLFLWTWDARPFPYWPDLTSVWSDGYLWRYGHWVQGKLGASGLAALVKQFCLESGLPEAKIDVSRLKGRVEGYVLNNATSARGALEQLMAAYFFDAVERDGQLVFVPRGDVSALTIASSELLPLDERDDARSGDVLAITRRQELELPRKLEVLYINRLQDYQQGSQYSARQNVDAKDSSSISLPIVMSDQQAKTVADVMLYTRWLERVRYRFDLPPRYAMLEPTDIITLTDGAVTHTIRLTSVERYRAGRLRCTGVAEDAAAYDFYLPPAERDSEVAVPLEQSETYYKLLDLPPLPNDSDGGVLRFAACGLDQDWQGCALYRSDDGGANYTQMGDTESSAILGNALTALGSGKTHVQDDVNTLEVSLLGENVSLSSAEKLALLNGANVMLVGEEIIQFAHAEEHAEGRYTLSGLLRGRLGTEHKVGSHVAGEQVVMLDTAINSYSMSDSLIGLSRAYKAVTIGDTLGDTAAGSFTYSGLSYKPFAPVHLSGERDGANNLTINWIRRTRLGGQWRDGADVPLSEESEAYEVDILDGETVVRTISATSQTASYTAAQQTTDFGSTQSSVSIIVYQISAKIGRGIGAQGAV